MIRTLLIGLVLFAAIELCQYSQEDVVTPVFTDEQYLWQNQESDSTPQAPANKVYVVAPTGDDSSVGSAEAPFATIQRAIDAAEAGETVLVHGGVYHEAITLNKSGKPGQPIRVTAVAGEVPVIDGQYVLPTGQAAGCNNQAQPQICFVFKALVTITGSDVEFSGFQVTQSRGRGIAVAGEPGNTPRHIKIANCQVHEVRNAGIHILYADEVLVEGCDVYHAGNFAPFSRNADDLNWPVIVNTPNSSHVIIRKSTIHENWGEGVAAGVNSSYIDIEDNVIYDNYALQIYIHRTAYVTVRRNLIYHTNEADFRRGGDPSQCVVLNNEEEKRGDTTVNHVTIANNVIVGCLVNVAIWGSEGTGAAIEDVSVAFNTLVNAHANANQRAALAILVAPKANIRNIRFSNNIIQQDGDKIASAPANPQLSFSDNLWSRTPPAALEGPGDVVGDPHLANPNQTLAPGAVEVGWYKPKEHSPALVYGMGPFVYLDKPHD